MMVRISRLLMVILVMALAVALVQTPALAGKGGEKGKVSAPTATLTADPNPVEANGAPYWLSGCGYKTGQQVNIVVTTPMTTAFWPVGVDANGCLTTTMWWTADPGEYTITASQRIKGRKQTVVGQTTLTVVQPE